VKVERVRVGEVLALRRREVAIDPEAEYRLIGIFSFGKGIIHHATTPGAELGDYRFFSIEPGDLVLSNIGAWEGGITFASTSDIGLIGNHRFLSYVPKCNRIDANWARWFFLSEPGMDLIRQAAPGTTMRNRTLAIDRFEALEIPLPPINEQLRVSHRLGYLSRSLERARSFMRRSGELANASAVSLTTRPDVDADTKYRAGWRQAALADVLEVSTGAVTVEPDERYPLAGIFSFGKGLIDRGIITGIDTSYSTLTKLRAGDVVVSKLNGWEGAVAVVDDYFDGFHVSSEYPTFKTRPGDLRADYFRGIARSPAFWSELNANARGSMVRRRRINPSEFLAAEVWLPPIDTQEAIARSVDKVNEVSNSYAHRSARIDALLPAALNAAFANLI
jgi:type I restriction enzyme, S subunit